MIDIVRQTREGDVGPRRAHHQIGDFGKISINGIAHLVQTRPVGNAVWHAASFDVWQFGNDSDAIATVDHVIFPSQRTFSWARQARTELIFCGDENRIHRKRLQIIYGCGVHFSGNGDTNRRSGAVGEEILVERLQNGDIDLVIFHGFCEVLWRWPGNLQGFLVRWLDKNRCGLAWDLLDSFENALEPGNCVRWTGNPRLQVVGEWCVLASTLEKLKKKSRIFLWENEWNSEGLIKNITFKNLNRRKLIIF